MKLGLERLGIHRGMGLWLLAPELITQLLCGGSCQERQASMDTGHGQLRAVGFPTCQLALSSHSWLGSSRMAPWSFYLPSFGIYFLSVWF